MGAVDDAVGVTAGAAETGEGFGFGVAAVALTCGWDCRLACVADRGSVRRVGCALPFSGLTGSSVLPISDNLARTEPLGILKVY